MTSVMAPCAARLLMAAPPASGQELCHHLITRGPTLPRLLFASCRSVRPFGLSWSSTNASWFLEDVRVGHSGAHVPIKRSGLAGIDIHHSAFRVVIIFARHGCHIDCVDRGATKKC